MNATLTTLLDKDKVIEILEHSRYVSDALASVRMMEGEPLQGEWIPISQRLPEDGETVLITMGNELEFGRLDGLEWEWLNESGAGYWASWATWEITAWQPLPEPYKGGDDE